MYKVRWDRVLFFLILLALPLLWHWMGEHVSIGDPSDWPVLNGICQSVDAKGLSLLGILLASTLIAVKVLIKD